MQPCGRGSYHKVTETYFVYFTFIYMVQLYKDQTILRMLVCRAVALLTTEQIVFMILIVIFFILFYVILFLLPEKAISPQILALFSRNPL